MPELPALLLLSIHFHFLLVTVVTMPPSALSQPSVLSSVRMAAILDDRSACGRGERLALALARENINSVMEGPARARVDVDVFELQKDSQYETTDTMCQILPKGVVSVIGPASSPASGSTVSHICGEKEIPHVKIGPEETPRLPYLRFASVTLYPSNEDLSLAVGAILRSFSYPSASLVCAKAECLLRLEELVRRFLISRETLSVRMLEDDLDPTSLLKEIRDDKVATIIIDANASVSYLILKKASELGMTSAFYKYILTTMDFPLLWLDDIVDEHSNIVGFSMFNTTHPFYLEFIRSLNLSWREGCDVNPYPGPALSSALLFDALLCCVQLSSALLFDALLCCVQLSSALLFDALLCCVQLSSALLFDALLCCVQLSSALLFDALLCCVQLLSALLFDALLCCVQLSSALLFDTLLCCVQLSSALLFDALLCCVRLSSALLFDALLCCLSSALLFDALLCCVQLSSALLFDAVHVVASAVQELNRSQEIGVKPLSCTSPQIWQHGTSLMNYLRMVEYDGLTGHVEFNSKGQRTNYTLHILEKHKTGHKQIGMWYSNNTLVMNSTSLDINVSETLANKTLIVTTILENPYVMRKVNYQELEGNAQYEGFCVDMLRELADILKFTYRIKLVDDGLYGAPEPNGSWTGMVGELINRYCPSHGSPGSLFPGFSVPRVLCSPGSLFPSLEQKADLAVAAFTITSEREKVIDFSKPFMTLGISILYRVHLGRKPGYFSFLDPFSPAVWLFMLLAYLAVSCVLFLAARLSPYEWYNPHPCLRERRDMLENQYTLGNSLWFPVGGFMQQGSEIMPKALSTRCVSGVWWAFTLIIISSYTANLAAFLTVQRMEAPIESPDDLADQTNIQYGTIHGGSTMTFFMNSRYQTYQRMWNYMYSKQPSVFVKSTEEGIARVLNSKYAFLLESTMNEYHRSLNCNLTQIGGLLDTKGYGIGMPLGSPFRDEISLAVLQLQESNRLEILKRRWWEGGQCPKEEDHRAKGKKPPSTANSFIYTHQYQTRLGMENIGGIFVVLICGLIIAVFVAVMEFVWSTRRSAETDEVRVSVPPLGYPSVCTSDCPAGPAFFQVSVCQEMLTEFRNAVSCKKSSRLRRRRPLSSTLALRHPARVTLGAPRPLRLVREMRLSNGKLYSGVGPLTGGASGAGAGPSELGPGPQRLLEDPLGASSTPTVPLGPPAVTVPLPRGCTHVRICQECRRIQSLRTTSCPRVPPSSAPLPRLAPPPPHSSSNTDSEGGGSHTPQRIGHSPPSRGVTSTELLGEQD
ncbi:hypothetical protein NFI96_027035 [Prochilodus magdalenae]|nr:hypothetical protein NFI96_027035 [Prochilodus magdalenae]